MARHVHGTNDRAAILEDDERPVRHVRAHVVGVRAIADLEEVLDAVREADERRQRRGIIRGRDSRLHGVEVELISTVPVVALPPLISVNLVDEWCGCSWRDF